MKFWEAVRAYEEGKNIRSISQLESEFISHERDDSCLGSELLFDLIKEEWEIYEEIAPSKSMDATPQATKGIDTKY